MTHIAPIDWKQAYYQLSAEVETILGEALGYASYPPGSPGYSAGTKTYAVGDHTPVTLALEAAKKIKTWVAHPGLREQSMSQPLRDMDNNPHEALIDETIKDAVQCTHENVWFSRTICPEPCGMMHDYCEDCNCLVGYCYWEEEQG